MLSSIINSLSDSLRKFTHNENASGIILFFCVVTALLWANSPFSDSYHHLWETSFSIGFADHVLSNSLHHWINDGLMAIFFFVVGLELKREFISGELSSPKKAILPIMAAIGGMIVPAVIYTAINYGKPSVSGWGIPMATDIAFAVGIISLAGNRIPLSVKVFLTALAVVDDLGAVIVIAFFYSSDISLISLGTGLFFFMVLFAGNLLGIRNLFFYMIIGIVGLWLAFLTSGIHPTLAGVLLAFSIPARTKIDEKAYLQSARNLLHEFEEEIPSNFSLTTPKQHHLIQQIKQVSIDAETPLQKLETLLHPWVSFLIMPVFALANSGVVFDADMLSDLSNPVTTGVGIGLIAGKFLGVFLFTKIMVSTKLAVLPENTTWKHIIGVSMLAGIGFTMSLFVTELAFSEKVMIEQAKYGILFASVLSGILGLLILKRK